MGAVATRGPGPANPWDVRTPRRRAGRKRKKRVTRMCGGGGGGRRHRFSKHFTWLLLDEEKRRRRWPECSISVAKQMGPSEPLARFAEHGKRKPSQYATRQEMLAGLEGSLLTFVCAG